MHGDGPFPLPFIPERGGGQEGQAHEPPPPLPPTVLLSGERRDAIREAGTQAVGTRVLVNVV